MSIDSNTKCIRLSPLEAKFPASQEYEQKLAEALEQIAALPPKKKEAPASTWFLWEPDNGT